MYKAFAQQLQSLWLERVIYRWFLEYTYYLNALMILSVSSKQVSKLNRLAYHQTVALKLKKLEIFA